MSDQTGMALEVGGPGGAVREREQPHAPSIETMMHLAVQQGPEGVEALEKLAGLMERMEDRAARKAFVEALSAFRAECPPIPKTRQNAQFSVTRDGVKRPAMYAPLEEIERTARPVAAKHGLTWTWDTEADASNIVVTCKVLHVSGHFETATVSMPHGSNAGASPQQKYAASQTYGMRYSLISALGLTTADEDLDGSAPDPVTCTDEQLANVRDLLTESGADEVAWLKYMGVDALADLPASKYPEAVKSLKKKIRQKAKADA